MSRATMKPVPLFEGVVRTGPKSDCPVGCPKSIWATIQKRKQRGGTKRHRITPGAPAWTAYDILELVRKHKQEPIGSPRKRPSIPEPPPRIMVVAIETVAYPKDICSPITVRLIQSGRLPGIHWDPERGGVRTAKVRRSA